MGKIAEKKEKKRNALLDTAFELFTVKGFSQTSVSDIVKEAGLLHDIGKRGGCRQGHILSVF